jgi:hypothetical protein
MEILGGPFIMQHFDRSLVNVNASVGLNHIVGKRQDARLVVWMPALEYTRTVTGKQAPPFRERFLNRERFTNLQISPDLKSVPRYIR